MQRFYREDLDQHGVRATQRFEASELIMAYGAVRWLPGPNRMTLQVSAHLHFELDPPLLESINHGCDPNVYFDVDRSELRTLRAIEAGEELTAFYPTSEWDMQSPFTCNCGTARCHGQIRGSKHLPAEVMATYRTSAFVTAQLAEAAAARAMDEAQVDGGLGLTAQGHAEYARGEASQAAPV